MKKITLLFSIFMIVGCGDEDGTTAPSPATSGTITGTLTLTGDNCPNTDLSISLHENWYPTGAPASSDLDVVITENSYSYTLSDIPFGAYSAIAVAWDSGVMTNGTTEQTMGFYGSMGIPTEVTLSTDEPTLENIDFTGDCSMLSQ